MELSESETVQEFIDLRKSKGQKPTVGPNRQKMFAGVPRYIVSLDDSPDTRWNQIVDDYIDSFKEVEKWVKNEAKDYLGKKLGPFVKNFASTLMSWVNGFGAVFYGKELSGMAKRARMEEGLLVMMQLVYEASTCCTSCVLEDSNGNPHHIRTMDWELEFLAPMTIEVDFQKGGESLYTCTTWAGYVGILTGVAPGVFSASVNFRVTENGSIWTNIKKALSASWPVGFLLRHTLETATSFNEAVSFLANSPLIAPVYYTVAGSKKGEGALITRNTEGEETRWTLKDNGIIVQTNVDHFMNENDENSFDILDSYTRRELARKLLGKLNDWKPLSLWMILSSPPILNSLTIYGTYMNPSVGYLETRLPGDQVGFVGARGDSSIFLRNFKDHAVYLNEHTSKQVDSSKVLFAEFIEIFSDPGPHQETPHDDMQVKCGFGLGPSKIGLQHWGCCYSTNRQVLTCVKSQAHVPASAADK